jgi:hypothetical protein
MQSKGNGFSKLIFVRQGNISELQHTENSSINNIL